MAMMAAGRAVSANPGPCRIVRATSGGLIEGFLFFSVPIESQLERFDRIECASRASTTSHDSCERTGRADLSETPQD